MVLRREGTDMLKNILKRFWELPMFILTISLVQVGMASTPKEQQRRLQAHKSTICRIESGTLS